MALKNVIGRNYKNEKYFSCNSKLIETLEGYCSKLEKKMLSDSFLVSEIHSHKKNGFENCWLNIPYSPVEQTGKPKEISGLYAFAEKKGNKITWKYIGISRTIKRRFQGHTRRSSKNSATLAHLIARETRNHKNAEGEIPNIQKEHIHSWYFTFIQIDDNMLLHIAEVYCANKFQSHWNSFKTH